MSDYDPMRRDPKRPAVNEAGYAADRASNWNWVIGGVAAIVVLIVALSFFGREDRTADTGQPAATTGQSSPVDSKRTTAPAAESPAPPAPPVPAERTAPPPANPNQ